VTDKLVELEGQVRPAGYYQRFGVTAVNESALYHAIARHVREDLGGTIVEVEDQGEPDFEGVDADIKELVTNVESPGIWYVSGHAFYINEESGSGDHTNRR
jgi:hypothetical protein